MDLDVKFKDPQRSKCESICTCIQKPEYLDPHIFLIDKLNKKNRIYVYMYIYMYICIYVCIYIYIKAKNILHITL